VLLTGTLAGPAQLKIGLVRGIPKILSESFHTGKKELGKHYIKQLDNLFESTMAFI